MEKRKENRWQQTGEKFKVLSGAQLKVIAMLSMLLDHVEKGILLDFIILKNSTNPAIQITSSIFTILGRMAFPIFLFMLVEGFVHTRSRVRYFLSLLLFGILAEVPYDMFESAMFVDWGGQNMYFTLALGLVTLCIVEKIKERFPKYWGIPTVFVTLFLGWLASYLALDYHFYGIIIPVLFYVFREKRLLGTVLSYLVVLKELWSITGFAATLLYNGERGRINKWFCYAFYPLHLLIIGLIRMYVI